MTCWILPKYVSGTTEIKTLFHLSEQPGVRWSGQEEGIWHRLALRDLSLLSASTTDLLGDPRTFHLLVFVCFEHKLFATVQPLAPSSVEPSKEYCNTIIIRDHAGFGKFRVGCLCHLLNDFQSLVYNMVIFYLIWNSQGNFLEWLNEIGQKL